MGLSRRAYARHRGVAESAVRKAIATGRITVDADGKIDPAKADREWELQTDPVKRHSRTNPVPRAARKTVDDTLREAGTAAPGGPAAYMRARAAREMIGAQVAKVKLAKMKGELVDRAKATALVFDLARRERDAWMNWPPRVAADMAAELGVDAHLMEQVLEHHLRRHLAELAEIEIELG